MGNYVCIQIKFIKLKKVSIIAAFFVTTIAVAQGHKTPAAIRNAFAKAYPAATQVKYEKEDGNYEVEFVLNGKEMSAVYDLNGALLATEEPVKANELPPAALTYYNAHYKGIAIKETTRIKDSKGVTTYEVGTQKKDIIFDATGRFLKAEPKAKD